MFSRTVPHIELIEGPSGSPWDATGGAHFHHLGWWAHSLSGSARQLAEAGLPPDFDGCPYGRRFAYHRMDSIGARIEIVDVAAQPAFLQTWSPGGDPMPALGDPKGPRHMTRTITPASGVDAGSAAACHAVLVELLAAIDHGHASTALDLFTEDALFTARGQQLRGRDAISGFRTEREAETDRQTVHIIANETARADDTREAVTLDAVLVLLVRNKAGHYVTDRVLDTTQQFVPSAARQPGS